MIYITLIAAASEIFLSRKESGKQIIKISRLYSDIILREKAMFTR